MIGEPGLRALSQRLFRNSAPVKPRTLGWETPSRNPKCSIPPLPPSGGGRVWPNCPGVVTPDECKIQFQALADLGVECVFLNGAMRNEERMITAVAEQVGVAFQASVVDVADTSARSECHGPAILR